MIVMFAMSQRRRLPSLESAAPAPSTSRLSNTALRTSEKLLSSAMYLSALGSGIRPIFLGRSASETFRIRSGFSLHATEQVDLVSYPINSNNRLPAFFKKLDFFSSPLLVVGIVPVTLC